MPVESALARGSGAMQQRCRHCGTIATRHRVSRDGVPMSLHNTGGSAARKSSSSKQQAAAAAAAAAAAVAAAAAASKQAAAAAAAAARSSNSKQASKQQASSNAAAAAVGTTDLQRIQRGEIFEGFEGFREAEGYDDARSTPSIARPSSASLPPARLSTVTCKPRAGWISMLRLKWLRTRNIATRLEDPPVCHKSQSAPMRSRLP